MTRAKFRTITPQLLPQKVFDEAFERASREMERDVKGAFSDAVSAWKHQPTWRGYVRVDNTSIYISVGTTDEIFKFVDEGTIPHIIRPKRPGGFLHWVSTDGADHFAKEVHHPGTKAQEITKSIHDIWINMMPEYFEKHLSQAVKDSGHKI